MCVLVGKRSCIYVYEGEAIKYDKRRILQHRFAAGQFCLKSVGVLVFLPQQHKQNNCYQQTNSYNNNNYNDDDDDDDVNNDGRHHSDCTKTMMMIVLLSSLRYS